jgi:hypothetical protein
LMQTHNFEIQKKQIILFTNLASCPEILLSDKSSTFKPLNLDNSSRSKPLISLKQMCTSFK